MNKIYKGQDNKWYVEGVDAFVFETENSAKKYAKQLDKKGW